jgi:uncharacterized membrane protein YedE/YeeE
MENFTPGSSVLGGVLIGLSATLLLLANGRIAGISGITNGLFTSSAGDKAWRACFLLGLVLGAGSYVTFFGLTFESPQRELPMLLAAGFLVGFGTRLGNGCTSGHGVCGIARFSIRSLVATGVFLVTAIATVWITTQVTGA